MFDSHTHAENEDLLSARATKRRAGLIGPWQRYSLGDWSVTLVLAVLGRYADKMVAPFERAIGPQLHDPTIAYPHTPNHMAHVSSTQLWFWAMWLPALLLVGVKLSRGSRQSLNELQLGLFSALSVALFFVSIVKVAVGRLRPDFLARCQPVGESCTGAAADIMEGRKSFPSGHSALAFAGLGYLSMCVAARLVHSEACPAAGQLWKLPATAAPWLVALLIGLSRIADYWHHWQDVLVGGLIGNAAALALYRLRFPPLAESDVPHALSAWLAARPKESPRVGPVSSDLETTDAQQPFA